MRNDIDENIKIFPANWIFDKIKFFIDGSWNNKTNVKVIINWIDKIPYTFRIKPFLTDASMFNCKSCSFSYWFSSS